MMDREARNRSYPYGVLVGTRRRTVSFAKRLAIGSVADLHLDRNTALSSEQWSYTPSAHQLSEEALLLAIERQMVDQALIEEEFRIKAAAIATVRTIHRSQIPWIENCKSAGRLCNRACPQRFTIRE